MKKANPPIHAEVSQSHGQFSSTSTSAADLLSDTPSKIARVADHLVNTGSLNRFEAERIGDHCLHSTISALANGYGLSFKRTPEKVPNGYGQPCDVIRYSLPVSEHRRARAVLALLCRKGKKVAA